MTRCRSKQKKTMRLVVFLFLYAEIAPTRSRGFHLPLPDAVWQVSSSTRARHSRLKSCGGLEAPKDMQSTRGPVKHSLPPHPLYNQVLNARLLLPSLSPTLYTACTISTSRPATSYNAKHQGEYSGRPPPMQVPHSNQKGYQDSLHGGRRMGTKHSTG